MTKFLIRNKLYLFQKYTFHQKINYFKLITKYFYCTTQYY